MRYDVIIVGGGPAGASAAITLASRGVRVLLLEEKRMPRGKLCGEFITPECFPTLRRVGVFDEMLSAGAERLNRICLVASNGQTVEMPLRAMSDEAAWAMSLSRAKFDQILFERAAKAGAECLEGMAVKQTLYDKGKPVGVEALSLASGNPVRFEGEIIIDASGRNSRLSLKHSERIGGIRGTRLYALKAHLECVDGIRDQVELYFFPGGYGGLSLVEGGLVNLCFIANERAFKRASGDPSRIVEQTVMRNDLARDRLRSARAHGKWHSVGPLTFGKRRLSKNGVIAIGDASGMIDPFTGTGIQLALRTGEIAAESLIEALDSAPVKSLDEIPLSSRVVALYGERYHKEFGNRMLVAGLLRRAAFSPAVANMLARVFAKTPWLARNVLKTTRIGHNAEIA